MATLVQQRPRARRAIGTVGYLFFLGIVLVVGMFCGWIGKSGIMTSLVKSTFGFGKKPAEVFNSNQYTILLLGCDENRQYTGYHQSRPISGPTRSDMMLVVRLDFDKKAVSGISIPRDMWFRMDGVGHKMNAYHALGGAPMAQKAVESLTGIPIDKVVELNYSAFETLVSMVGGIEVDVDKDLDYDDDAGNLHIHIKKGHHHLDGAQAMGFVRYRHGDDDFHRQARQKQFLMAFKGAALSHWSNLPAIAEQSVQVLSGALNDDEVAALAIFAKGVPSQNIKMGVVPAINPDATPMELDRRGLQRALVQYGFQSSESSRVVSSR